MVGMELGQEERVGFSWGGRKGPGQEYRRVRSQKSSGKEEVLLG